MPISAVTALAATRSAIGASAWLIPTTAAKLFGMDTSSDDSADLFLRLGGTRDFALAAGPLVSGAGRRQMLRVAAACDVADLVAVAIALRRGRISRLSAVLFGSGSLVCLRLGAKALSEATES
ncbi:hypothetical protein [Nocardia miyunensis]|uniref:hypothetical protein n=1 Tax=Nocardia miyunensis TaxID=282684 RepID=UPI000AED96B3|nr:hypothetical protein [Nocardia miyunensis]